MGLWVVISFVLTRDSWKIIQVDFHLCYGYLMLLDLLRGDHKRGDESAIYIKLFIYYTNVIYLQYIYKLYMKYVSDVYRIHYQWGRTIVPISKIMLMSLAK